MTIINKYYLSNYLNLNNHINKKLINKKSIFLSFLFDYKFLFMRSFLNIFIILFNLNFFSYLNYKSKQKFKLNLNKLFIMIVHVNYNNLFFN